MSVDPIVVSAQIINNLQTVISRNVNITENPAVVTIGSIHGGNRDNIISETVEMIGTVRTFSDADEKLVYRRIKEIAEYTAKSAGATAEVILPFEHYYPVTFNNEKLTADMLPTLQKSAGKEKVILMVPETGAEDFSFFAQKIPGLYFFIGGLPKGHDPKTSGPHHTPSFIIDDSAFTTGVKAMCNLVIDYTEMNKK
jgi:amidohydrolase